LEPGIRGALNPIIFQVTASTSEHFTVPRMK
jgi:hypothetical protein